MITQTPAPAERTPDERLIRAAVIGGLVGPALLGGTIAALTALEYRFLQSLGWHWLNAPTTDWPSGLALGPYGPIMIGTFAVSGGLLAVFAAGLREALPPTRGARLATGALGLAGVALAALAFKTDPTFRTTPATWHGLVHDGSFGVLGVALLGALALLVPQFRQLPAWRGHASYTAITALLVAPAFALKGGFFYPFLINILIWIARTAWLLRRNGQGAGGPPPHAGAAADAGR